MIEVTQNQKKEVGNIKVATNIQKKKVQIKILKQKLKASQKKRIYTIKEKIKIVEEAINSSINSCSKKYVIDRKSIRMNIKTIKKN